MDSDFSQKKLEKLFEKYKDPEGEDINPVGVMAFIQDLDLIPTDPILTVIAWNLKAKQMGIFTREQFVGGFKALGLDSIEKIKARLPQFREELKDAQKLAQIYKYSFEFYKDEKNKKSIEIELVDTILQILIPEKPHIPKLRKFIMKQKQYKVLNLDQWIAIHDFSCTVGTDLSNYEEDEWPVLIEMYVEWLREGHTGDTEEEPEKKEEKKTNDMDI
uniref:Defective in cullin neddylation protein n=1 Tax=Arcella intermedia TaxID=1963864 RepID=A0A6B2LG92_9EUKA